MSLASAFTPRVAAAAVCALFALACGTGGATTEASKPVRTSPVQAPDAGAAPPPDGAVVRTIEQRNPFGNTRAATNLAADGDFELTGRSAQMPWIAFGKSGQVALTFDTGGRCRSGIRCGVLGAGESLIGYLASPKVGGLVVSFWASPQSGVCADLEAHVVDFDGVVAATPEIRSTSEAPTPSGYCHFEGRAPSYAGHAPVLLLEIPAASKTRVTIDDLVVSPEPPEPSAPASAKLRAQTMPSARVAARARFIATWLHEHRVFNVRRAIASERAALRNSIRDMPIGP